MSLNRLIEYIHHYSGRIESGRVPTGEREIVHAERMKDTWEIDVGDDPSSPPYRRRVAYFVTNYVGRYMDDYGIVVAVDQAGHPPYGRAIADAVFKYYVAYFEAIADRSALPAPPPRCRLVSRESVSAEGSVRGVVNATIAL